MVYALFIGISVFSMVEMRKQMDTYFSILPIELAQEIDKFRVWQNVFSDYPHATGPRLIAIERLEREFAKSPSIIQNAEFICLLLDWIFGCYLPSDGTDFENIKTLATKFACTGAEQWITNYEWKHSRPPY